MIGPQYVFCSRAHWHLSAEEGVQGTQAPPATSCPLAVPASPCRIVASWYPSLKKHALCLPLRLAFLHCIAELAMAKRDVDGIVKKPLLSSRISSMKFMQRRAATQSVAPEAPAEVA